MDPDDKFALVLLGMALTFILLLYITISIGEHLNG